MSELVTKEDLRINNQLLVYEIVTKLGGLVVAAVAALGVVLKLVL